MALALPWEYAAEIAAASAAVGAGLALSRRPAARAVGAFLREAGLVIALYGLWQLAGRLSVTGTGGALARTRWIAHAQSLAHLPSEASMQHLVLWSPLVTQAANIYYATVHFPATIAFLIWLFVRHREQYSPVRWVLAATTLACLVIQLMPVAPPRLLPGYVDTAAEYGQSVYGSGFGADQLSAMPSVHVAWALLVGYYVWRIARSRWRWIGPVHAAVTIVVVVVTANHWWADGIVAAAALVASAWVVAGVRRWWSGPRHSGQTRLTAPWQHLGQIRATFVDLRRRSAARMSKSGADRDFAGPSARG
jgi:hypothetical protein